MKWTAERYKRLAELRDEGLTAAQIAKELGGVTRNAVIGTANRLGLVKQTGPRTGSVVPKRKPVRKRVENHGNYVRLVEAVSPAVPVIDQRADVPVTLFDLQSHHCRWPIGDPVLFCGGTKLDGQAYCEHHYSIAYVPYRRRG